MQFFVDHISKHVIMLILHTNNYLALFNAINSMGAITNRVTMCHNQVYERKN